MQVATMSCAPLPVDEDQRLAALHRYRVMDTPPEPAFDRLAHIAHHMLHTPTALVSLVDSDRQWFKSRIGLDTAETPRKWSLCSHAVAAKDVLVVPDARNDLRFSDNPLVTGPPGIRFYVGAPLITADGFALGTICALDYAPRPTTGPEDIGCLRLLADCVVFALEQRMAVRDLAARERALLEKSELLQTTINAAGQGISAFDADLKLVSRNDKFLELLDLPPELGNLGTPFEAISAAVAKYGGYGSGDPDAWVVARSEAVRRGRPHRLEIIRGDGHVIEVRGFPVPGGGRVTTYTDITEQRRHADELQRQLAEREAIVRMKDEFVATVSHELRTPLTALSGALGLLESGQAGPLPHPADDMVAMAHKSSQRLIKLVGDIFDIEKLESGSARFHIAPYRLAPLVEQAVAQTKPIAEMFYVTFELRMMAPDAMALVDPDRCIQAVTNLLSNAAKFSPPGKKVRVTVDRCDGRVRLSVTDRGPGIPLEFRQRVFERFAQADSSDKRRFGGSGLGLTIVKQIVENLNGTVDFETEAARGTTFHIYFPEWCATGAVAAPPHRHSN
jgi:signal transduction histidine kinase